MRYIVPVSLIIEARDDMQATELAKKLGALLKHPMVRMAMEGENIPLSGGDGRPVVYAPQREGG